MWKFVSRGIRESLERRANCSTNIYSHTSQDGTLKSEVNPTRTACAVDQPRKIGCLITRYINICRGIQAANPTTYKSRGSRWNPKYSWGEAVEWSGLLAVGWIICQSLCFHRRILCPDLDSVWRKRISQVHDVRISQILGALFCLEPRHVLPISNCVGNHSENDAGDKNIQDFNLNSQTPYGPITIEEALQDAGNDFTRIHRIVMGEYEFQMGMKALEEKRYKEAVKHFTTGASLSSSSSMFNLALCHEMGLGTLVDQKEAARRYQAAAENGHADAMYNLGVFHAQGRGGLQVNMQKARKLFTEAAELGQQQAKYALTLDKPIANNRQNVDEQEIVRCLPVDKVANVNTGGNLLVQLVGL
ncbi:uncharacterized protein LOC105684147 [Athalia rosae]|uniref:uncharacterized protein LOC105684147 n=1 Tax=Athalia rosae TaxID=37344 RepID=UPI0020332671|nr:uncharacterized protein LOC105684147 [Athalia rosae]